MQQTLLKLRYLDPGDSVILRFDTWTLVDRET